MEVHSSLYIGKLLVGSMILYFLSINPACGSNRGREVGCKRSSGREWSSVGECGVLTVSRPTQHPVITLWFSLPPSGEGGRKMGVGREGETVSDLRRPKKGGGSRWPIILSYRL